MKNLDARISELRKLMEDKYLSGEKGEALEISYRLDRLIALAQRELIVGQTVLCENKER